MFWQESKFEETIHKLNSLSINNINGIKVIEGRDEILITNKEEIINFINISKSFESKRWGKTDSSKKHIEYEITPLGIKILAHTRGNDTYNIYGYVGLQEGNKFTNYGQIISDELLDWTDTNIWLTENSKALIENTVP